MKPGDHPDFFRLPPPEGRSRESSIVLDREGRFWHEGALVAHPGMAEAFTRWIGRHPDDGRYVLNNGYDWTYITVEDTPFFVRGLVDTAGNTPMLRLSDDSVEPLDPRKLQLGPDGAVYAQVKDGERARFTRSAQLALEPLLEAEPDGGIVVHAGQMRARLAGSPGPPG